MEKLGRYWLYDAVIFYILDRIDEILKQRKDLAKQIDKSVSKIKLDMQPIVYQLTEVYSAYEICEYLDVDYKSLVGTDFNNISPIDAIFDLKRNNQTFTPIDDSARLIETLADYIHFTPINLTALKEPIRGMTKEDYMNYKLEYLKNERDVIAHYYKQM